MSCVGDRGTAAEIIQINDSHWFRPSESPTNITVFPLIFIRNSTPLNLQQQKGLVLEENARTKLLHTYYYVGSPWKLAIGGFPAVSQVIGVGSTVQLAIEFRVDNGAGRGLINWVRVVMNPTT